MTFPKSLHTRLPLSGAEEGGLSEGPRCFPQAGFNPHQLKSKAKQTNENEALEGFTGHPCARREQMKRLYEGTASESGRQLPGGPHILHGVPQTRIQRSGLHSLRGRIAVWGFL